MTVGDFADGPDIMLWNPGVTTKRWRRQVVRVLLARLLSIPCAAGFILLSTCATDTLGGALATGGAVALMLSGLCDAAITASHLATDHPRGCRCRLERVPGEFFLRSDDFVNLGAAAHRTAGLLVDLTGELYVTPARSWMDPELPNRVHQVVWDALTRLVRTAPARRHAARLSAMAGEAELAATIATAIAEFDDQLAELVLHLQGCVALTREWEAKLHHAELQAASIRPMVEVAEELARSVFAYVTAARDLSDAGRFPWERPLPEPVP
ncbi:hypothetical protein [Amycolatopsis sp. NPDC004625]|uniref:hypothetical protein n=1 Tax=Amycolatopsis sp. NPDC004625 TaxID=3154670 RepID=UPI0033B1DE2D